MKHVFSRDNAISWCTCDNSGTGSLWDTLEYAFRNTSKYSKRYMVDIGRANPGCTYYGLFKDYDDFISQHPELLI